eukprot:210160-Pelagomonas_calceolata.AAC.3
MQCRLSGGGHGQKVVELLCLAAEQKMPSMACPAHPPPWNLACLPSKKLHRRICAWVAGQCCGQ